MSDRRIFLVPLILTTLAIPAWGLMCGDTLTGGTHRLMADLDCSAVFVPTALTLVGAALDLNGYTVHGYPTEIGITLDGQGSHVSNGQVTGFLGIYLGGSGQHTISRIDSAGIFGAIWIDSDQNLVEESTTQGDFGIVVHGHDNRLLRNTGEGGPTVWLELYGHRNRARGNIALVAEWGAIVEGNSNLVAENRFEAMMPLRAGIEVSGVNNLILRNVAQGFAPDGLDTHGHCDANLWSGNIFATGEPACVMQTLRPVLATGGDETHE